MPYRHASSVDENARARIRLSEAIKKRIARLALAHDKTVHAFMLEAIHEKVEAEEMRAQFHAEAKRRLPRMKKTGSAIPSNEVFDYLSARARGGKASRPSPRSAISVLDQHPEIGRPIGGGSTLRKLVISQGKTGYVALYEYARAIQLVPIVAVRHRREAGYRGQ